MLDSGSQVTVYSKDYTSDGPLRRDEHRDRVLLAANGEPMQAPESDLALVCTTRKRDVEHFDYLMVDSGALLCVCPESA